MPRPRKSLWAWLSSAPAIFAGHLLLLAGDRSAGFDTLLKSARVGSPFYRFNTGVECLHQIDDLGSFLPNLLPRRFLDLAAFVQQALQPFPFIMMLRGPIHSALNSERRSWPMETHAHPA